MSLPRPPISANTPIPNQPFSADEVYYLEGNQGRLPLGNGLYIDPATGAFTDIEPSPYIYCVPQFDNLPVTYPPYGCETEVNTAGVTDFTRAWYACYGITEFPCVDSSAVTDFTRAWGYSYNIISFPALNTSSGVLFDETWSEFFYATSFPLIDVSKGESFYYAWGYWESLESFPLLDVSSGTNFNGAWQNCSSLTSFPILDVSQGTNFVAAWFGCSGLTSFPLLDVNSGMQFGFAWQDCTSLTTFPAGMFDNCSAKLFNYSWENCSLDETSVDNILVSLDIAGQSNGVVNISNGTSAAPGTAGQAAVLSLVSKGWIVATN
jgi:hypothetical protein